MQTIYTILSYVFSFKLWIILCLLIFISNLYNFMNAYIKLQSEINAKKYDYNREKIIAHLDELITDALNRYNILNLAPMNTLYITSSMQDEIMQKLVNEIPKQISPVLMDKLSLLYNDDYINTFLGEYIYMSVVNFVLNFNVNEAPYRAAAMSSTQNIYKNNNNNDGTSLGSSGLIPIDSL